MRRLVPVLVGVALLAALAIGGFWYVGNRLTRAADPVTVSTASLEAMRAQNRLVPFAARFVAVTTSQQSRFGLSARKTLIMPGMVRYAINLAALQPADLKWDAVTTTLSVTLPPIEVEGPEVDLAAIKEYGEGGVLMALTNAEATLDAANRKAGQAELLKQARADLPMKLARDAARSAIERSFAMPLAAAGIEAKVVARFADEQEK